jgi:hypothetical protein
MGDGRKARRQQGRVIPSAGAGRRGIAVSIHFQDIVRLTQRLIALGKTNRDLAPYPVEDHGFVRPSSWADEYRRIFELFETHLAKRGPAAANGEHK